MKVRTTLYPNGGERRGHTLHKEWEMPDAHFPKNKEEAERRSAQAMRHWLGVEPKAVTSSVTSNLNDEFIVEGKNWKVEWRMRGAVQRYTEEIDALRAGDSDAYWHALTRNRLHLGQVDASLFRTGT